MDLRDTGSATSNALVCRPDNGAREEYAGRREHGTEAGDQFPELASRENANPCDVRDQAGSGPARDRARRCEHRTEAGDQVQELAEAEAENAGHATAGP